MPDKLPRLARRAALACALASLALGVLSNAALALDDRKRPASPCV